MNERGSSNPRSGYRSEMPPRRPARNAAPAPRQRIFDHDAGPADPPPAAAAAAANPRIAPARKTAAPRRPVTRRIEEDVEQFDDAESAYGDLEPERDHRWRVPIDEPEEELEDLEEDEFPEPDPDEDEAFRAPAIRDAASLPPTLSIVEAGEWLGIGRTVAYELARDGAFPVRTIRVGNQRRVITVELLSMLGIPLAR